MSNGLKATLTISMVLNVLLAGMLLGDWSRNMITVAPFDQAQLGRLSPEERSLFEATLTPEKADMDAAHAKMDGIKAEAVRIVKTVPFDEAAYMRQVRKLEDVHSQMKLHTAQALAKLAGELKTPEERDVLAQIISHPPFTMPPHPEKGPGEKP